MPKLTRKDLVMYFSFNMSLDGTNLIKGLRPTYKYKKNNG